MKGLELTELKEIEEEIECRIEFDKEWIIKKEDHTQQKGYLIYNFSFKIELENKSREMKILPIPNKEWEKYFEYKLKIGKLEFDLFLLNNDSKFQRNLNYDPLRIDALSTIKSRNRIAVTVDSRFPTFLFLNRIFCENENKKFSFLASVDASLKLDLENWKNLVK